MHDMMAHATVS